MSDSLWTYGLYSLPGSSVREILQARILEWVAIPFSRGSSQARDWTGYPVLHGDSLPFEPPGKPMAVVYFKRSTAKSAMGKGMWGCPEKSKCMLSSGFTQDSISPATSYDSTGEMLPVGKNLRASMPRVFIAGSSYQPICQQISKFQTFRRTAGVHHKPYYLYKQCRHSGPLVS